MPLSHIQPEHYESALQAKVDNVRELLSDFYCEPPEVHRSAPTGFRLRAEFRIWHDGDALDYVMYRRDDPKTPVPIQHFPIVHESIQTLMPALREELKTNATLRRKLFQVEFLSTLAGEMLVTLIYHRKLDAEWEEAALALRERLNTLCPRMSIVGRSRKQKVVLGADWVNETLTVNGREYHYVQYEQSFTQPNALVNSAMIEWACDAAQSCTGDLLELYCGNGNFTLPLAAYFDNVLATELSKSSTRAARTNIESNAIANAHVVRLSAEEVAQAMSGFREFRRLATLPQPLDQYKLNTVFVDPPRAGLDEATVQMAAQFPTILYISCNPHTLAENLRTLQATHSVEKFALFDQFPYTEHMECGVLLKAIEANANN